jgi:hypothetical protein
MLDSQSGQLSAVLCFVLSFFIGETHSFFLFGAYPYDAKTCAYIHTCASFIFVIIPGESLESCLPHYVH